MGGTYETIVTPHDAIAAQCAQLPAYRDAGGTRWSADVAFTADPPLPGCESSYAVFVEEVESFMPASDQPGASPAAAVESGPRFAARLPIVLDHPGRRPPGSDAGKADRHRSPKGSKP